MDKIPYRILLVDDDPFILIGICKELEAEGYAVSTAASGESAVEMLESKQGSIDLVITDLIMGAVDGIQVLDTSKRLNPECMVMILTGYGELSSAIAAISHGADDYMLKPASPEERCFRISELISKFELQRKVKLYEDIMPICCVCKQIRDDTGTSKGQGSWRSIEDFLYQEGKVKVTSTYCPICYQKELLALKKDGVQNENKRTPGQ